MRFRFLVWLALSGSMIVASGCKRDEQPAGASPSTTRPVVVPPAPTSSPEVPKRYLLHVESPQTVSTGAPSSSTIVLQSTGEFHINREFPMEVKVSAEEVALTKSELRQADAVFKSDREVSFSIPFSAAQAGEKRFSAALRFAVCTQKDCYPMRDTLSWTVKVEPGQGGKMRRVK